MKINFYNNDNLEITIYADYKKQEVHMENHTADWLHLAFGVKQNPTWKDFEDFLEDRCPPRVRANIKEVLESLGLQHYDPISICEKTSGRTAEDNSWMDFDYERD